MDNQSSSETVGKGFTFPCEFIIKVFGPATPEFSDAVLGILRHHVPNISDSSVQKRSSKDGKYLALSITINAESREQLDAIYRELTAHPLVLTAL